MATGRDANLLAHHDGSGAFIDHDFGRPIGLDRQALRARAMNSVVCVEKLAGIATLTRPELSA